MNGANGHSSGTGTGSASYRHILDLTRAPPPADLDKPIEKLLSDIENDARQADFLADIGRLDTALELYLKAFSQVVKGVPNHRDFVYVQNNRDNRRDRFTRLKTQLDDAYPRYDKIKEIIKEDNAKTGVRPVSAALSNGDGASDGRPTTPNRPGPPATKPTTPVIKSASPGREKPAVQPKPASLHGSPIQKGSGGGQADDLKQRLANLRNTSARNLPAPKQDPRIRTNPPLGPFPEKPSSPTRDATSPVREPGRQLGAKGVPDAPPKLTTSLDGVIGQLPKLPDAIYSPARGNMSSEAANLPTSTPRGMFSRTASSTNFYPSKTSASNLVKSPSVDEPLRNGKRPASVPPRTDRAALPEGDIITVEDLIKYQKSPHYRILFIDVRPRDDFEDGHIMSSATICIEPDIIERPRIEARDVEDSMEIGSAEEKSLFERRHDFDIVVIYDQDSSHLGLSSTSSAAARLFTILRDFDYPDGDPGSKHPKLLKGGLDAWQDSFGGSALQNSSHKRRKSTYDKPWLKSPTKPIQSAEEARKWEQHLTKPEHDGMDSDEPDFTPVRNINDFLDFNTRFPPVQESMTSPVGVSVETWPPPLPRSPPPPFPPPSQGPTEYPTLPSEPTRPPPAVPRRSFTGLQPPDDDQGTAAKVVSRNDPAARRRAIGLQNPGNWCYANSTLQALFASGGFGEELCSQAWQSVYKPPKKKDEKILPPQLLTKIMANLFLWMGTGKFNSMKADTLMVSLCLQKLPVPLECGLGTERC